VFTSLIMLTRVQSAVSRRASKAAEDPPAEKGGSTAGEHSDARACFAPDARGLKMFAKPLPNATEIHSSTENRSSQQRY